MTKRLEGKVAIVTGAGSQYGKTLLQAAREGEYDCVSQWAYALGYRDNVG